MAVLATGSLHLVAVEAPDSLPSAEAEAALRMRTLKLSSLVEASAALETSAVALHVLMLAVVGFVVDLSGFHLVPILERSAAVELLV